MSDKPKGFFKSMKWYEWIIFVEACLLLILCIVSVSYSAESVARGLLGVFAVAACVSVDFILPIFAARACRRRSYKKLSNVIIFVSVIGYGILGLLFSVFVIFKKVDPATESSCWIYTASPSLRFTAGKKCAHCGLPAPDSVALGSVCVNCSAVLDS
jgi:hypothetical protein